MEEPHTPNEPEARVVALGALIALLLVFSLSACGGGAEQATPSATAPTSTTPTISSTSPSTPTSHVTPTPLAIPDTEIADNITLPQGFSAYAVATGFFRATSIAIADDGTIYVSERHGTVKRLADDDRDGVFESITTFAAPGGEITGLLAAPDGGLYVSKTGALLLVRDEDGDGTVDGSEEIVSDLPTGRHQNNGLVFGPDGNLYLTVGSTCDDCDEADELSATILRYSGEGELQVFATGLRNAYDLAFDLQGRLWATDNGSDAPCETIDELNLIVEGGDYGWPYADDGCDPLADGIPPTASLGLHTAATGIDSYEADQFPPDYRGDLFVTLWGSFFAEPELEPQLLRVRIDQRVDESGVQLAGEVETFATGFQHPIDALVDHDGTLLVLDYGTGGADDRDGTLYRIIYTG